MKPVIFRRLWLLAACLLLIVGGCGRKGPVKPLQHPLPAAPGKLSALQQGNLMRLSWEIPSVNQDGSALTDLQGFKVFRMRYDLGKDCPECRDTSTLLAQVDLELLKNADRLGNRLIFWDQETLPGNGYRYRVTALTRANREGDPATVQRPFLSAATPPAAPTAQALDRMVRLTWTPPPLAPGEELLGYNLYRSPGDEPDAVLPVNAVLLNEPLFEDFGLVNGSRYRYTLRSVLLREETTLESPASLAVEISPQAGQ